MRTASKLIALIALVVAGCSDTGKVKVPDHEGALKSSAAVRAETRLKSFWRQERMLRAVVSRNICISTPSSTP